MKALYLCLIFLLFIILYMLTTIIVFMKTANISDKYKMLSEKHFQMFLLLYNWMKKDQEDIDICTKLEQSNCKKIAIYGYHYVGELLVTELQKNKNLEVKYIIDKKCEDIITDIHTIAPQKINSDLDIDIIIVTAIFFYDDIYKELKDKVSCPIVSLEQLICE